MHFKRHTDAMARATRAPTGHRIEERMKQKERMKGKKERTKEKKK